MLLIVYIWPRDTDLGPNVNAHLSQALALAVDGTLAIDHYANSSFTYTIDWSQAPNGRLYPAKAPGCALALAPVMWLLVRGERIVGADPLSGGAIWRKAILANWILNAFPAALCMVLLFRVIQTLGVPADAAFAGILAVALGTAYHPYATAFYAHVPAANLLVVAVATIFRRAKRDWLDVLGGMSAGFAVVFDYAAVLAVIACGLALLALRRHAAVAFVAGGLVPLGILLTYHQVVFGSPWATAYQFQNPVFTPPDGSLFEPPQFRVLAALLVSPFRGVLFYSPVVIAALPGALYLWREQPSQDDDDLVWIRRVYVTFALCTLAAWLLLNASYFTWTGGYTTGPRFIVPALVLLAPLIAAAWQRWPLITTILLCCSALNQFAIAAVWMQANDNYLNPLAQVIYPRLLAGDFVRSNLGMRFGLPGVWSLVPLAAVLTAALSLAAAEIKWHSSALPPGSRPHS
ncbi:hypothetical protein BH18ACI5_BH18ACI5_18910 [soil metagenome]